MLLRIWRWPRIWRSGRSSRQEDRVPQGLTSAISTETSPHDMLAYEITRTIQRMRETRNQLAEHEQQRLELWGLLISSVATNQIAIFLFCPEKGTLRVSRDEIHFHSALEDSVPSERLTIGAASDTVLELESPLSYILTCCYLGNEDRVHIEVHERDYYI